MAPCAGVLRVPESLVLGGPAEGSRRPQQQLQVPVHAQDAAAMQVQEVEDLRGMAGSRAGA